MNNSMSFDIRPEDAQVIEQAIRAGLIAQAGDVVEVGIQTLRTRLETVRGSGESARAEAVRRMREFGERYRLSLSEPITRELMHEGHRF
ncbi:MAG TPA: hypothetical protein VMO17_20945 [Terriglobia bacterium]|nr:hypothetical protein [Terriglobia bacterium]